MKTLLALPNALGDIVCGLGLAHRWRTEGSVTWVLSGYSEDFAREILAPEGFECAIMPSRPIRRMSHLGAPTELMRRESKDFLEDVRNHGPYDRIANLHLTRAAGIISGSAVSSGSAIIGPLIGESLQSDAWSDFFITSTHFGFLPEIPVVERYSLIAGEHRPVMPEFSSWRRAPSTGATILFQPGAGWPSKRIPPRQALETSKALSRLGRLIVTGGPEDAEIYESLSGLPGIETLWGHRREQLEALAAATLVVTADTWILHAAYALDAPTLALLGPTRIFPMRNGWALAPRAEASWAARGDTGIEVLTADAVAEAARRFLDTGEIALEWPGITVWDCREDFPIPSRPLEGAGPLSEKRLFSWARAMAFNELIGRHSHETLPLARLRPRDAWRQNYEKPGEIMERVARRIADFTEGFQVPMSTFPKSVPENVAHEWAEATLQILLAGA